MRTALGRREWLGLSGVWLVSAARSAHELPAKDRVRMPGPDWDVSRERPFFQRDLLKLALNKVGGSWAVELLRTQTWLRQVREMRDGHAEVAPLPALDTAYAEFKLRRIDFPLRRGLPGLRRLLVRADRVAEFETVRDLATLQRRFRLGSGQDWVDLPEMRRLGFQMVAEPNKGALYAGLRRGSIDFLSRGLHEAGVELDQYRGASPGFAVLPGLALFYPLDDCFFVAPGRDDLHQAIEQGLNKAWADGSYHSLFRRHFESQLTSLRGVTLLELKDYPVPPGLPLQRFDVRSLIPAARI